MLTRFSLPSALQADIDNSGTIDYGEFLAATVHLNKLEREENLLSAFSFFDKDDSGFITIDELQQACKEFGLNDLHLDEMIKEIDQDNVSFLKCVLFIKRENLIALIIIIVIIIFLKANLRLSYHVS